MKTRYSILTILFVSLATTLFSQYIDFGSSHYYPAIAPRKSALATTSFYDLNNSETLNRIAPKMYLSQNYLTAKIAGKSELIKMNYNIFTDEMEFEKDGEVFTLKKEINRRVYFKDSPNYFQVFKYDNKLQYFEVLNSGNVQLLVRKIVKYKKGKAQKSSYDNTIKPDFKRKSDKLYVKFNEKIIEIPSKNKTFYALLQNNSSKVKKFVDENKLKVKNKKDMLKIVNFLNSI